MDNRNHTSTHSYKYSTMNTPNYNCVTDQATPENCQITSMKQYPASSHERQVPFEIIGAGHEKFLSRSLHTQSTGSHWKYTQTFTRRFNPRSRYGVRIVCSQILLYPAQVYFSELKQSFVYEIGSSDQISTECEAINMVLICTYNVILCNMLSEIYCFACVSSLTPR